MGKKATTKQLNHKVQTFSFQIPFLPPTTNKAYYNTQFGRKLKTEAKTFKNKIKQYIAENYFNYKINPYSIFSLNIIFKLPYENLICKTYPKSKSLYQRWDTDTHIKLLKDALVEALSIDNDTQIFSETIAKTIGEPSIEITLTELPFSFFKGSFPEDFEKKFYNFCNKYKDE